MIENNPLVDKFNVVWGKPGGGSTDSMPLGNGDLGVNAWTEKNGDLLFYIGKTDSWDTHCRLLKLGRLRLHLSGNPFAAGKPFRQELFLKTGEIVIEAGNSEEQLTVRMWVDANRPLINVEAASATPFELTVSLELWRKNRLLDPKNEAGYVQELGAGIPVREYADTVVDTSRDARFTDQLAWYQRNEASAYPFSLQLQALGEIPEQTDPLLHRTFGCVVAGDGMKASNERTLVSATPATSLHLSIHALTEQTETVDDWLDELASLRDTSAEVPLAGARAAHQRWWGEFWNRSWLVLSGGNEEETRNISLGWHLHRYICACTGRGAYPIKFNGSIFTVEGCAPFGEAHDWVTADHRWWGTPYWHQNTRLIYWPMSAAGDYDLMLPLFKMYLNALPLAKKRVQVYYDHEGALFPETMSFWGAFSNGNYGLDREGKPDGLTDNLHIRFCWQGMLELTASMLEYFEHTGDEAFARETLLPLATEILNFYDQHYERDENGKLRIFPAQVIEWLRDAVNPMPEVAGLQRCLSGLLDLPDSLTTAELREQWLRLLDETPPLPTTEIDGRTVLASDENEQERFGSMYAIWPYRLVGVCAEQPELARRTLQAYGVDGPNRCWHHDISFAAYAGNAAMARSHLAERFVQSGPFRFPAFYSEGDHPPDHDNGGVCQTTIQGMLMQTEGDKIYLLPAWPKEWDCDFRLHAPGKTTVTASVRKGEVVSLDVSPTERRKDIFVLQAQ